MAEKPDVTFVNNMTVSGFVNGVVNLSFTTARFEARDGVVAVEEFPSADLRMDLNCAQQLRDALDKIIEQNTTPPREAQN